MLIALAFAVLAIFLGGDSPFIIPKLDNYVKTHVVDDGRKTIVLESLDEAKDKRKAKVKQGEKELKKLDHLFNSRTATKEEMELVVKNIMDLQAESQEANIRVNQEAQKNITEEEWGAIIIDMGKGLEKADKTINKANTSISKAYTKWESKIEKSIVDENKKTKALESAHKLQAIYLKNREIIEAELMNKNSKMYQYNSPEADLNVLQNQFITLMQEVLDTVVATHFELVDLTTEEEWKKIL